MERDIMSMAMAPRLSLERSYNNTASPCYNLRSILVSTANRASRMLVNAASAASGVTGEGERWRPMDHVRYFVMLSACVTVWALRAMIDFFASPSPSVTSFIMDRFPDSVISGMAAGAVVVHGGVGHGPGWSSSNTAIGRALSHILGILNEIPATSRKYELILSMADNMIADNLMDCRLSLHDSTRAALSSAFSRTCEHLHRSLRRSSEAASSSATWPSRALRHLPLGPHLAAGYETLRLSFQSFFSGEGSNADILSRSHHNLAIQFQGMNFGSNEWLEAEKLAHELFWIASKMRMCSIVGEAIVKWGYASNLATLALTAHPRVQAPIVKISAMLFLELARGEWEAPREVKLRMLLVWLPVLCYASSGISCPVLMGSERLEMEVVLEDVISGLPREDQEVVLRNWLEDFASTDSDWPNLRRCFDQWCHNTRKLLL